MNYEELVKALRSCDEYAFCNDCPIFETCDGDVDKAMALAAAAIDALQAELSSVIADAGARIGKAEAEVKRLEPKRGEWKVDMSHFSPYIVCSVCGVEIPCVAGWCMDAHMNYCPNCGAKMTGEQDVE